MKLIGKKDFTVIVFNPDNKTFAVQIVFLTSFNLDIDNHFSCRVEIAFLIVDDTLTVVLSEYTDFADVFFLDFAAKLSEYTRINNHPINLFKD